MNLMANVFLFICASRCPDLNASTSPRSSSVPVEGTSSIAAVPFERDGW